MLRQNRALYIQLAASIRRLAPIHLVPGPSLFFGRARLFLAPIARVSLEDCRQMAAVFVSSIGQKTDMAAREFGALWAWLAGRSEVN
jgi:hypothetical protein